MRKPVGESLELIVSVISLRNDTFLNLLNHEDDITLH